MMHFAPTRDELGNAARALRRSPGFTAASVASMGLAIALAVIMLGVVDALVAPRYPFVHQDQLYRVGWIVIGPQKLRLQPGRFAVDVPAELRRAVPTVAQVTPLGSAPWPLLGPLEVSGGTAEVATESGVGLDFFSVLGVHPLLGRVFTVRDSAAEADHLVVISDQLWQRLYPNRKAFAPFVAYVRGTPYTVIGVLPDRMRQAFRTDVWAARNFRDDWGASTTILIRAKPGVSTETLRQSLAPINAELSKETGTQQALLQVEPVAASELRNESLAVGLTLAAFAVLLIACVNVANLQLARGMVRARDLAVRCALGAQRRDIARLLATETAIVVVTAGILAALLAIAGTAVVRSIIPQQMTSLGFVDPQMSWHVYLAGVLITSLAAVGCGLPPALRVSKVNVDEVLKSRAGTGVTKTVRQRYAVLVAVEVGCATALFIGAGWMTGSAHNLRALNFGYTPKRVLVADFDAPYTTADSKNQIIASVIEGALAIEHVAQAAVSSDFPFGVERITTDDPTLAIPEMVADEEGEYRLVTADYLRVLGASMIAGSDFRHGDDGTVPVAIVDSVAAAAYWPGINPIGHVIKLGPRGSNEPWIRVIGVVRNVRYRIDRHSEFDAPVPEIYVLANHYGDDAVSMAGAPPSRPPIMSGGLFVRTQIETHTVARSLDAVLRGHFGALVGSGARPLDETTGRVALEEEQDFMASLFVVFGGLGLLLTAVGIYGVVAYAVGQRTREFGVRVALGAGTWDIVRLVLRDNNLAVLLGLALGLDGVKHGWQFLSRFIFAFDVHAQTGIFVVAPAVMLLAAFAASVAPALRAARVDPVEALRSD